jgi:hypothetical protein
MERWERICAGGGERGNTVREQWFEDIWIIDFIISIEDIHLASFALMLWLWYKVLELKWNNEESFEGMIENF